MMVNEEFKNGKEVYCTNGGKTMPLTTHLGMVYTTNCDNLGGWFIIVLPTWYYSIVLCTIVGSIIQMTSNDNDYCYEI